MTRQISLGFITYRVETIVDPRQRDDYTWDADPGWCYWQTVTTPRGRLMGFTAARLNEALTLQDRRKRDAEHSALHTEPGIARPGWTKPDKPPRTQDL